MASNDHHGMKTLEGMGAYCRSAHYSAKQRDDRFGRMFPQLSPAYTPQHILEDIGRAGGPMDSGAGSDETEGVPVGLIFFGQFIDHDITLDASTTFDTNVDNPGEIANVRTPTLDLDCIYGLGPEAQPYMYSQEGDFAGAKLLVGADAAAQAGRNKDDLLRAPNGRAIIGDPRNDENRVISQLQLGVIRFHNHVCDTLNTEEGYTGAELYEHARQTVTWHYQWAVVNDYLTAICGKPVVDRILGCGRDFYCGNTPYIPIEFSVAAYRYGHSMIPMTVKVQGNRDPEELFGDVLGEGFVALADAKAIVDWNQMLVTPGNANPAKAQKLDTKMASDLLALPFITNAENSLATRNLLRGNIFLLPGGEKVAEHMADKIGLASSQIDAVKAKVAQLNGELSDHGIPLWLYLLAEAEEIGRAETDGSFKKGEGLGPVGATIVAETMIGLMELDDHSFLGSSRNWSPRPDWNTLGKMLTVAQP